MDNEGLTDRLLEDCLQQGAFRGRADDLPEAKLRPIRRLLWAKLLAVVSGEDPQGWVQQLQAHRCSYLALQEEHRKEADVKQHDPNVCNPLSKSANNPFLKMQANEDLLQEIWKDVERTFPEKELFQEDDNRKVIQRVLYHWCKACNPAVQASESYRQGMNELAALCFYVIKQGEYSGSNASSLSSQLSGKGYTEADTFALLSAVLERGGLREMFAIVRAVPSTKPKEPDIGLLPSRAPRNQTPAQQRSAVLIRSDFIFHTVLKRVDPALYRLLVDFGVEPQLFLLRWLRLLFCREFPIDDTVHLWTHVFLDAGCEQSPMADQYPKAAGVTVSWTPAAAAASKALPLADYFAVAMIEHLREELFQEDESGCLMLLMKYPSVETLLPLVKAARHLRAGHALANPPSGAQQTPASESGRGATADTSAPPAQDPLTANVCFRRAEAAPPASPQKASVVSAPAAPAPGVSQAVVAGAQGLVRSVLDAGRQVLQEGGSASSSATSALNPEVLRLQQRVQSLEQEKVALMAKAKQFVAKQTQELKAEVEDLRAQLAAANGSQGNPLQESPQKPLLQDERDLQDLEQRLQASEEARAAAEDRAAAAEAHGRHLEARVAQLEGRLQEVEGAATAISGIGVGSGGQGDGVGSVAAGVEDALL
mmetsp:Transcript_51669/g.123003  ORF Transcript_51669/g.123003 Transcript_51669/m.123003 type:complete len:653 (+) Transcript_51669:47-2005(+)